MGTQVTRQGRTHEILQGNDLCAALIRQDRHQGWETWIAECVEEFCLGACRLPDAFHVVAWASSTGVADAALLYAKKRIYVRLGSSLQDA